MFMCLRIYAFLRVRARVCVYSRMRIVYAHVLFLCMCVMGLYVYVNAVNVSVEENVHAICVSKTTYECDRMIVILHFDVQA